MKNISALGLTAISAKDDTSIMKMISAIQD